MSSKKTGVSRRRFMGSAGIITLGAGTGGARPSGRPAATSDADDGPPDKPGVKDGPASTLFTPLLLPGNTTLPDLGRADLSEALRSQVSRAPSGNCVCWGIPFVVQKVVLAREAPVDLQWSPVQAPWLIFMHTSDVVTPERNSDGFPATPRGDRRLGETIAHYVLRYDDGTEARVPIRRQYQTGPVSQGWGTPCFEAVAHRKPCPTLTLSEQPREGMGWGGSQTLVVQNDMLPWTNWLWAWHNPNPEKPVSGLRIEPKAGAIVLSAVTVGRVSSMPLRWEMRRKAILRLGSEKFRPQLTNEGLLEQVQLDLGQVISAHHRTVYPGADWSNTYNNKTPEISTSEILVEYTAHPEAWFHLWDGARIPEADVLKPGTDRIRPVPRATQRVTLRVVEKGSSKPVAVKLHVHGEAGEYLAPADRNRIPNSFWYEDWSVDYVNAGSHDCTYIPGETTIDLPIGKVYVEISKGFEIAPTRRVVEVDERTTELVFTLDRVLDWRRRGWVSADTHVHFLSPPSAHLEGAGEGVNVVNLLASQWGEMMTNVGDFDGKTTFGSKEAGGDGEYLVRVGTENRQHVLGHISLLGYNGRIVSPMTTGGPDEAALGDPVDVLLTEWARQCHKQGGLVVLPHFPDPRAEHAATIISGDIDAVEMTSWGNLYGGISPYSLSDWYRYLNNGYFVAAVGGTDKMAADTAVGTVRTYARIPGDQPFSYEAWKTSVRSGNTFVTYGPLLEFSVDGKPAGSRITMSQSGGTVDVEWQAASVTTPMSRVDLVVNGVIRESRRVDPRDDRGHWSVKLEKSSWLALLVRGHYSDKPEIVAAHSSPVMVEVKGSQFFAAADALTILEQVEGALVYLDVLGTRAEAAAYKRMRLVLTGAYRDLHNRLHQNGHLHEHTQLTEHGK